MNYRLLIVFVIFLRSYAQDYNEFGHNVKLEFNGSNNIELISSIRSKENIDTLKLFFKNNSTVEFKILHPLNLNIKISDSLFGKKLLIFPNKESEIFKQVSLSYILKIPDDIKTRNFFSDDNQLYLLPDLEYIPSILNNVNIQYIFSIKSNNKFSYIDKDSEIEKNKTPYVLMGNFYLKNVDKIEALIPKNINYDDEKLLSILKIVDSSCKFFSEIYGTPNKKEKFKVFFLNRSGGHAHTSGLILDQNYLIQGKLNNRLKMLISHEVAHYWWGINVNSSQSSLLEGLSEYSALLYMEEIEKVNIKDFYGDKNIYLEKNQINKIKFDTITPYNNKNNLYRNFSYYKLPIIIKELETKVGKEKLIEKLSQLFNSFHMSDKKITYDNFINLFAEFEIQNELKNDLFGLEKQWTDFYIKNVVGNSVIYCGDGLHNKEKIKVKLTDFKNNFHSDTIFFRDKNEILKEYPFQIKRVVIDPDFECNQKTTLNDVFDVNNVYSSNSKYGKFLDNKFYIFSDKIIEYLFYNVNRVDDLVIDESKKNKLSEIANKTRKINTNGFLIFVDEKINILKLFVSFSSNDENILGYIQIKYFEKGGVIYLNNLDKIKL